MEKKWPNRFKLLASFLGLGIIFMGVGFFTWDRQCSESRETAAVLPRPVKSIVVQDRPGLETRSFPGLVHAAGETNLAFRVGGILEEFNVVTGQKVKKGQVIARMDTRDFHLNILRLEAALEEARVTLEAMEKGARKEDIAALTAQVNARKANFERSRKQLERSDKLFSNQFVTTAQHDQAVADFTTQKSSYEADVQVLEKAKRGARKEDILAMKARIKQLTAGLAAGQNSLEDTQLKAPFDGIVNQRFVEKYETIATGQPIVSLLDFKTVDVKTAIPEEILLKRAVFKGISCSLDAYPGKVFVAVIKELGLKTSTANQSFPLTVSLIIPETLDVQPGMSASLEIQYSPKALGDPGFLLPSSAVFSDSDGAASAWKIDPVTRMVSKIQLKTDRVKADQILVLEGLHAGDRIVTAGARFLIQGQPVCLLKGSEGLN